MVKRLAIIALIACMLMFCGCLSMEVPPAVSAPGVKPEPSDIKSASALHLNGTAYDATLTVNGLPFTGTLARQDAATGWQFRLSGEQTEQIELMGIPVERTWELSIDLSKKGLTPDVNGLYSGKVSIALNYELERFDQEVYDLVKWERGDGVDFDNQQIKGWKSHDEYESSQLDKLWQSDDFTLYIGGLDNGRPYAAKTLGHTLSYLPESTKLHISHKLLFDLPGLGEAYEYSLQGDVNKQMALLHLKQYTGKQKKALPPEPVASFDLYTACNALTESYILLELSAKN